MIALVRASINLKTKEVTEEIIEYRDEEIDYTPIVSILYERIMKEYSEKNEKRREGE